MADPQKGAQNVARSVTTQVAPVTPATPSSEAVEAPATAVPVQQPAIGPKGAAAAAKVESTFDSIESTFNEALVAYTAQAQASFVNAAGLAVMAAHMGTIIDTLLRNPRSELLDKYLAFIKANSKGIATEDALARGIAELGVRKRGTIERITIVNSIFHHIVRADKSLNFDLIGKVVNAYGNGEDIVVWIKRKLRLTDL
jgi:hypothetical protein